MSKYNQVKYLCQKRHKTIEQLEQQLQKLQSQSEQSQQNGKHPVSLDDRQEKENTPTNCNRCAGGIGGDAKTLALDVKRLETEIATLRSENQTLLSKLKQDPDDARTSALVSENDRLKV